MCLTSRMTDNKIREGRLLRSVGVTLLLFALAPSLSCISLQRLSKTVQREKRVNKAAATEVRTGHILFNGKDINVRLRSSSVDNSGLAHVDLPQSDGTGILEQAFQLETAQEAAWRRLNPLLSCGQTKMKLKAMGPGAAYLQLDMGVFNGIVQSLPLMQVPSSCGYSMRQNALGLVLVVPYDGCSVVQENGYYMLPLSWMQNPVKLACPLSQSADATADAAPPSPTTTQTTTTTTTTPTTPLQTTINAPAMNPPANPIYPYFPYAPYPFVWQQPTVAPATSAPTTAQPVAISDATTSASNPNFPPFPYPPFYPPFGLPQPTVAPATPASTMVTAQPSTPAMPTPGPAPKLPIYPNYPYPYHQYPYHIWYASDPLNVPATTTLPPATTTGSPTPTPGLPEQPNPNYPIYQNYPVGIPSQSAFYYPYIQPPYPQNLNPFTGCSGDQSPTTPFASTSACFDKMPNGYLDFSQYHSYDWFPFRQYMWHNRAGKHPYGWRYRSQAGYLPGMQTWAQTYPGFMYQQPMPWFSYSPGQDTPQSDWRNNKGV